MQGMHRGATNPREGWRVPVPWARGPEPSLRGISPPSSDRPSCSSAPTGDRIPVAGGHNAPVNVALRIVLLVWVLGYVLVSCGPLLGGHLLIGGLTFIAGVALFVPWLIGVVILAFAIWATNPTRRR